MSKEKSAIALYVTLARDPLDFILEMQGSNDETVKMLYLLLATPNKDHNAGTKELNRIGVSIVERELSKREVPLPAIPS
jgi:hypothetical protein